jgi:hypothetical protein
MGKLHEQVFVTDPILQTTREIGYSARPHDAIWVLEAIKVWIESVA